VDRLYVCDQRVKLTPPECPRLLGQVTAVVAIEDLHASPYRVGYLLEVLSSCSLVIGSAWPVLSRHGSSHKLDGLPEPLDSPNYVERRSLGRDLLFQMYGSRMEQGALTPR
jgi:hypothetical protein